LIRGADRGDGSIPRAEKSGSQTAAGAARQQKAGARHKYPQVNGASQANGAKVSQWSGQSKRHFYWSWR
jgi:hypothetical protein